MFGLCVRREYEEKCFSCFSTYVSAPSRAFRPNAIDLCRQCRKRVLHLFEPAVGQFLLNCLSLGFFSGGKNGKVSFLSNNHHKLEIFLFYQEVSKREGEKIVPTHYKRERKQTRSRRDNIHDKICNFSIISKNDFSVLAKIYD